MILCMQRSCFSDSHTPDLWLLELERASLKLSRNAKAAKARFCQFFLGMFPEHSDLNRLPLWVALQSKVRFLPSSHPLETPLALKAVGAPEIYCTSVNFSTVEPHLLCLDQCSKDAPKPSAKSSDCRTWWSTSQFCWKASFGFGALGFKLMGFKVHVLVAFPLHFRCSPENAGHRKTET